MTGVTQSEPDLDAEVRTAWRRFYHAVEDILKHFPPEKLGPAVVALRRHYKNLHKKTDNPQYMALALPFRIAFIIEANCGYARGHRNRDFTDNDLRKMHNLWYEFNDPQDTYLIKNDIEMFFTRMWWQQIESQQTFTVPDISRYQRIFVTSNRMRHLDKEFAGKYGLTLAEWCMSNFCILSSILSSSTHTVILPRPVPLEGLNIESRAIEAYLDEASKSPGQIGARFRRLRDNTDARHHSEIRTVFGEYPLIAYGQHRYLAPFPERLFHDSGRGIYRRIRSLPSFSKDFGPSVEDYVELVVSCLHSRRDVIRPERLTETVDTKVCDFIIQFDDMAWLIESKGVAFRRNNISPKTVLADSSTRRMQDGIEQLTSTATLIRGGTFAPYGIPEDTPLFGSIVTFDYIPFANLPRYFREFIVKPSSIEFACIDRSGPLFSELPFVLDIETLERLIIVLNDGTKSLQSLVTEWREAGMGKAGDRNSFVAKIMHEQEGSRFLPHMQEDFDEFCNTIEGTKGSDKGE